MCLLYTSLIFCAFPYRVVQVQGLFTGELRGTQEGWIKPLVTCEYSYGVGVRDGVESRKIDKRTYVSTLRHPMSQLRSLPLSPCLSRPLVLFPVSDPQTLVPSFDVTEERPTGRRGDTTVSWIPVPCPNRHPINPKTETHL